MGALKFITGHVIFKLCYNQIYQLKTTLNLLIDKGNYVFKKITFAAKTIVFVDS